MRRTGAIFAVAGAVAGAAVLGAGAVEMLHGSGAVAGGLAGAALGSAAVLAGAGWRELRQIQSQREALSGVVVGIAKRLAAIEPRLSHLEQSLGRRAERMAVDRELGELGALVRLLAEQVEGHDILLGADARLDGETAAVAAPAFAAVSPAPQAPPVHVQPSAPAAHPRPAAPAAVSAAPVPPPAPQANTLLDAGGRLRDALRRGAVDLQLRAIVALPQRRTLHYEVTAQFRNRDGSTVSAADVKAATGAARLAGAADAAVLERAMRVARRLRERQRDVSVFVRLSPELWGAEPAAAEVMQRLQAGVDLAQHLVLQFSDAALRGFGAAERDMFAGLHQKGFRLAVAELKDLNVDARSLHALGVRFVKAPPHLLLSADAALTAEIHPDDLSDFLKRHNILLIADPVEQEGTVAELIDMNITAVQGPLFGAPRPVRAEVFAEKGASPEPDIGEGVGMRLARRA